MIQAVLSFRSGPALRPAFCALALLIAGLVSVLAPDGAHAATSAWAVSDGGRMRLVVLPPAPDGSRQAGLQIEPNDGWFTYWREPGDSGIPPQLTVSDDAGFTASPLTFPVPKRMDIGSVRDVGYDHAVVFPFTLRSHGETWQNPLRLMAFIGMCRNICIPFQAELNIDLGHEETTDVSEVKLIEKAKSKLPASASDDFHVDDFHMAQDLSSLDVSLVVPDGSKDEPRILVTGPEGYLFTEYTVLSNKGNQRSLRVTLPKLPRNYTVDGKTWHILVAAGNKRAMEAPLAFATSRPIVQP
ncbi:protein-disulfide reductase DsbD domain-containing protein [Allorhizobium taibaishanense]|uniref:DsbC/DsbD-like thiol-disulfide interchange protein n=1 Tax=Allorhizobium taibaishanense TaxID=887144 RepID=A0A7W6MTF1_9HYPH|nr:protein-disulfide reductase DsbD domain-containing protein [Allorhizobium taibaishanense]MBB4007070.1 DsbC/DsbD-like thiol-disulfide interchange protein [Allorhizobium taibaishanense]